MPFNLHANNPNDHYDNGSCYDDFSLQLHHLIILDSAPTLLMVRHTAPDVASDRDHVLLHVVVPVPLLLCDEAPEYTSSLITQTGDGGAIWLTEG